MSDFKSGMNYPSKMSEQDGLREKIANVLRRYGDFMSGDAGATDVLDIDEALEEILQACKEAGLKFVISEGSYGFEAEFEEINV